MSSETWPPQLKELVTKCLMQTLGMDDRSREEAQVELRQVITEAVTANTLWTKDWSEVQLKSLQQKVDTADMKETVSSTVGQGSEGSAPADTAE